MLIPAEWNSGRQTERPLILCSYSVSLFGSPSRTQRERQVPSADWQPSPRTQPGQPRSFYCLEFAPCQHQNASRAVRGRRDKPENCTLHFLDCVCVFPCCFCSLVPEMSVRLCFVTVLTTFLIQGPRRPRPLILVQRHHLPTRLPTSVAENAELRKG